MPARGHVRALFIDEKSDLGPNEDTSELTQWQERFGFHVWLGRLAHASWGDRLGEFLPRAREELSRSLPPPPPPLRLPVPLTSSSRRGKSDRSMRGRPSDDNLLSLPVFASLGCVGSFCLLSLSLYNNSNYWICTAKGTAQGGTPTDARQAASTQRRGDARLIPNFETSGKELQNALSKFLNNNFAHQLLLWVQYFSPPPPPHVQPLQQSGSRFF